ncbi:Retrovirus-related Pol polyprotein from transposon TNT 1-94-like protein, partial [Drosera capensis]
KLWSGGNATCLAGIGQEIPGRYTSLVNVRPNQYPNIQKNIIEQLVKELLDGGVIQPSSSPYSSPMVLIRKKDRTWRMCIDYRELNKHTIKNMYPIPVIEELLDELHGSCMYLKIDLRSGYHQIRMDPLEVEYLGHLISRNGVDQLTLRKLRQCKPLTKLLKKDAFLWCEEAQRSFEELKSAIINAPVLALSNFKEEFVIETDASGIGVGGYVDAKGIPNCLYKHFLVSEKYSPFSIMQRIPHDFCLFLDPSVFLGLSQAPKSFFVALLMQSGRIESSGRVYVIRGRHNRTRVICAEEVVLDDGENELMMLESDELTCYQEAAAEGTWYQTIQKELESIEKNNTWTLTELPPGHTSIGLKWVFKLKKDSDGQVVKHKVRLVAKGYIQRQDIDFEEVFASIVRLNTVRVILALTANRSCEVHHMDVKSAFLNGELEKEIYISQPEGFEVQG